jgi:hypothetical protein
VVAAEKKDTFILTNVREWPIGNTDMGKYGKRYYWLDKAGKDLRGHAGHTIQVIGKISDVDKSEIEFKAGESAGYRANRRPGKDVRRRRPTPRESGHTRQERHPDHAAEGEGDEIKMTSRPATA